MTAPLTHVTPGEPLRPTARDWNRFVDTARTVDAQRSIWGVPDFAGATDGILFVKITTAGGALDCSSIAVGTSTHVGEGEYLEGKFCTAKGIIEPGDGDGQDDGDPLEVYAAKTLRGLLVKDAVVQVVARSGTNNTTVYDAIAGGLEDFEGEVITAVADDYTVEILATGAGIVTVPAVSVHGDEFVVGQAVSLCWQWLSFTTSRLKMYDASCPPDPEAPP